MGEVLCWRDDGLMPLYCQVFSAEEAQHDKAFGWMDRGWGVMKIHDLQWIFTREVE